ncbi:MAG: hypothetical protein KDC27_15515 [Acidobacteria bacterium]|nr:hypothetical protein [Acidobacteriota bacterium]
MKRNRANVLVCAVMALGFAVGASAWEEPELDQKMVQASELEQSVQKGLQGDHKPAAAESAVRLAALFDDIHDFWERKGVESAQERSHDVAVRARAVASLIERGDFNGAKLAAKNMNGNCQGCHKVYGVTIAK